MIAPLRTSVTVAAVVALTFSTLIARAQDEKVENPPAPQKFGVLLNNPGAFPGYNLINPGRKQTYLFDNEGRVVHTWISEYASGAAVYLLDDGHLFRPAEAPNREPGFQGPAAGGRIQEFDWDGNLVWDFEYHSAKRLPHHDAIKLPNGNALLICWERIDEKEAVAAGRRPETVKDSHLQPDCLVEIKPTGPTSGEIVWQWRSWDHLIQDRDKDKPNYGKVSDHPERFDVNYMGGEDDRPPPGNDTKAASQDAPKNDPPPAVRKNPDWMHVNAVAFNAELDQIALSSPHFNEIWIIDHGTTTEEARGHTGGRWGRGGDILYRWGNPRAYGIGTNLDRRLFFQHNIQWIPKGMPGEGHLLVFNNGGGRKPQEYSSVDEFVPPTDEEGNYVRPKRAPFGPEKALWSYTAPNPTDFHSWFISGAQRLENGNTLINSGAVGDVFEATPGNEVVWKFSNPFKRVGPAPPAAPVKRFDLLAGPIRDALGLTADQRKRLDELDGELVAKLDQALTAEEIKKFADTLSDAQKALIADRNRRQPAVAGGGPPRRQGNTLFRATRYALNHPAFAGRTLLPGKTVVELEEEFDKQKSEAEASAKTAAAGTAGS